MRISRRYTKGLGNAALYLRLRKLGLYWDFVALVGAGAESTNTKLFLTEYADAGDPVESSYEVEFTPPADIWTVDVVVVATGETIATGDTLEPSKEPTLLDLEATLLEFEQRVLAQLPTTAHVFTAGERIVVPRGDKVDLPFALGSLHDCTGGKRLFFYARDNKTDELFIDGLECTLTDALNVIGTVPLTPALLATARSCTYEYKRRNADGTSDPHTPIQGPMSIGETLKQ